MENCCCGGYIRYRILDRIETVVLLVESTLKVNDFMEAFVLYSKDCENEFLVKQVHTSGRKATTFIANTQYDILRYLLNE